MYISIHLQISSCARRLLIHVSVTAIIYALSIQGGINVELGSSRFAIKFFALVQNYIVERHYGMCLLRVVEGAGRVVPPVLARSA